MFCCSCSNVNARNWASSSDTIESWSAARVPILPACTTDDETVEKLFRHFHCSPRIHTRPYTAIEARGACQGIYCLVHSRLGRQLDKSGLGPCLGLRYLFLSSSHCPMNGQACVIDISLDWTMCRPIRPTVAVMEALIGSLVVPRCPVSHGRSRADAKGGQWAPIQTVAQHVVQES